MAPDAALNQWLGTSVGPYRLEQILDQGTLGPVFRGRERNSGTEVRIRLLNVPAARTDEAADAYRHILDREAPQIAALRPPYILPLTDYGVQHGVAYLVWPHLVTRPLSARLAQSGYMDIVTVGRYLDQIASALEAAHAQGILHLNLSADCVLLQLDSQSVVADFGVRRMVELLSAPRPALSFYGSSEACAPEQVTHGVVGPETDVYALGALTYRLFTGQPVYTAETVDALLQQHLRAPVPGLQRVRSGMPFALDAVLASALAKNPTSRFPTPGAFADAYHRVTATGVGSRVPFGARAPVSPPETGSSLPMNSNPPRNTNSLATSSLSTALPSLGAVPSDAPAASGRSGSLPSGVSRTGARSPMPNRLLAVVASNRAGIIATILLLLIFGSGGLFILEGGRLFGGGAHPSAQVEFVDGPSGPAGHSDALQVTVQGLSAPSDGSHYAAWILNSQTESVVRLGSLTSSASGYTLTYNGNGSSGQPGTNLIAAGDTIEVTREQGSSNNPLGAVVLKGALPPHAAVHIAHLLVSFPNTPGQIGLLVGVLDQTQLLDEQATALQNAAASHNTVAVSCAAQSILDIIEGAKGTNYRALPAGCNAQNISLTGDGYGLLSPTASSSTGATPAPFGYLDGATDHASLAATQDDATADIRLHAGHVETAIANIKGWVTTADQNALKLLKTPTDSGAAADLVTVSDHAYHGVPGDVDQQINPVPGQAGAVTAYEHGQFMAAITLQPAS